MSRGRRPALDGIRAVAITAVFGSHVLPELSGGWVGVEVFFVLSGYLITSQLLHERDTSGGIRVGRFYLRRAFRLYPALLAVLAVGAIFYRDLGDGGTLAGYGRTALNAGLYLQDFVWGFSGARGGFGHTWSLAVEEQFYLLWPLALTLLLKRRRTVLAASAGLGLLCLGMTAVFEAVQAASGQLPPDPPGSYFLPWVQAPLLLAGCALAAWAPRPGRRLAAGLAGGGAAGLVVLVDVAGTIGRPGHLALLLALSALAAMALICGVETLPSAGVARILSWRPIEYLGRISYGWYVWYLVVIELFAAHYHGRHLIGVPVEWLVVTACAVVSHHLVEQPFHRCRAALEARSAARRHEAALPEREALAPSHS